MKMCPVHLGDPLLSCGGDWGVLGTATRGRVGREYRDSTVPTKQV